MTTRVSSPPAAAFPPGLRAAALLAVLLLALTGCQWPRDPGGTLDRVRGGTLRVGVSENPPWTRIAADGTVHGAEAVLARRVADRLDARVHWIPGAESALMAAMESGQLDLVVGGLRADAPWQHHASLTASYATTRTVVGLPSNTPGGVLPNVAVAVRPGTEEIGLLREEGLRPAVHTGRYPPPGEPAVVGEWRLFGSELRDSGVELRSSDHVVAVPLGENGWQTTVEDILLDTPRKEVLRLLAAAETGKEE